MHSGSIDQNERGEVGKLLRPLPCVQGARSVGAHDQEQVGIRLTGMERLECLHGKRRATTPDLEIGSLDAAQIGDSGLHHRKPILGRTDLPGTDLLPWLVGHDEKDPIEIQGRTDVDRSKEMADMRWIEGPPQHADPFPFL